MAKKGSGYTREGLKVPQNILDMADKIKAESKIGEGGVVGKFEKDFWKTLLPDGTSADDVMRVDRFKTDVVAAQALAGGELGVETFHANKDSKQVSLEFNVNKDMLGTCVDRTKTFPNRMGGENAPDVLRQCHITSRFQVNAVGNRGAYQQVRTHMRDQGAAIFG